MTIADRFSDLPLTFRETKLGPWPNYYLALVELLMREPSADAFMLVQDDVIFDDRHDLRAYLEEILWPTEPIAAVSLYCSKAYTRPESGWHKLESQWIWGALAFVFPRESAKQFVTDPLVFEHRSHPKEGLANIDILIGAGLMSVNCRSTFLPPAWYSISAMIARSGPTPNLAPSANGAPIGSPETSTKTRSPIVRLERRRGRKFTYATFDRCTCKRCGLRHLVSVLNANGAAPTASLNSIGTFQM